MADSDDPRDEADRAAILARRRRFVAATLTGLTTSTLATACPCLKTVPSTLPAEPDEAGPAEDLADDPGAADAEETAEGEAEADDGDSVEEASPQDGEIPPEAAAPEGG